LVSDDKEERDEKEIVSDDKEERDEKERFSCKS